MDPVEIALYCPHSLEPWDAESLKAGIGGSEASAIHLARELAALGHGVGVFNSVTDSTEIGGVDYMPAGLIAGGTVSGVDALIVWRYAEAIVADLKHVKAKKKVLWLHDVVPEKELLPYIYLYDVIAVQTAYHRDLYPSVPKERFAVLPSGFDPAAFTEGRTRDPWKLAYFSNYDRGLYVLLENWTQLKLTFPELTLTVGYGWDTLERLASQRGPEHRASFGWFKGYMENLLGQDGVTHVGRVSQAEVVRHLKEAQLLAYPCTYLETACLVGIQAQAAGAVPCVIPSGALIETVLHGFVAADAEDWMGRMVHALSHPDEVEEMRAEAVPAAYAAFSWPELARRWQEELSRV